IDNRENFVYSVRTCLPENVCKFLFDRDALTYVALVSLIAGLRRAVRLQWLFHCDHDHGIIFKTTLLFVCYFLFLQINSCAFGET
ncbi:hypothetical protein T12_4860, partial [Trichinella patagoniensis]